MIANESTAPESSFKTLDAMSICRHARAHICTYIPFKLLKSQARDGLKKDTRDIGSNGKDIYQYSFMTWKKNQSKQTNEKKKHNCATVPSRVHVTEVKSVFKV